LATSCFNAIKHVAKTNGEAADEIRDLLDEAFDAFSLLPNAAAQFGLCGKSSSDSIVKDPAGLILGHLKQAEKLLEDFCNFDDGHLTLSKVAILQRYLPSLARLCYKVRHVVFLSDLFLLKGAIVLLTLCGLIC
jgi:hypothetical protein